MRRDLTVSFLLSGASFTVLQALMVRELVVSFSGNELSMGFVLGAWLLLQALGSALAGRLVHRLPAGPAPYAWVQAAFALLLLPAMLLAFHLRPLLGAVPGEALSPLAALGGALLVLLPVAPLGGAAFAGACRALEGLGRAGVLPGSRVYALEALGAIAGGLVFTYLFLPLLSTTQIVLLLALLNLASAGVLFLAARPRHLLGAATASLLAGAALAALLSPLASMVHQALVAGRWSPYRLVFEGNSPYGNVAVIAVGEQITVLANGTPVLTAPDPDLAAMEEMAHLPALFLEGSPRSALVIGGGAGGLLAELERWPLQRLDYAEMDPLLLRAVQSVPTSLTTAELGDPRLRIALEDGRSFVLGCADGRGYDLILLNLPPPTTLELNRLHTRQFLEQARACLAPRGVLVLTAPPARTYLSPSARDLLAGYAATLGAVFPHLRAIPADGQTLWLASPALPLDLGWEEVAARLRQRAPALRVLGEDSLRYLLDDAVAARFAAGIAQGPAAVNSDGYPQALRCAMAYESARLAPALEPFFRRLGALRWWHGALGLLLLSGAGLLAIRRPPGAVRLAVASTGLAGMTADLLVLLAFQVLFGYVYQQVGLLVAAFMAGLALGSFLMARGAGRLRRPGRALALLEGALLLTMAGLGGALFWLLGRPAPSLGEHALLVTLNLLVGGLVGLEFPLANHLLVGQGRSAGKAGASPGPAGTAGALYAWDLAGSVLGALLVSTVLLPALGLVETALLVALAKAGSLALVGRVLLPEH